MNATQRTLIVPDAAGDVAEELQRAVIAACRRVRRPARQSRDVIDAYRSAFLANDYNGAELLEMLTLLPLRERFAVVLKFYTDQSEAEIAKHLHCTVPTARRLVARGALRLRRMMPDE